MQNKHDKAQSQCQNNVKYETVKVEQITLRSDIGLEDDF